MYIYIDIFIIMMRAAQLHKLFFIRFIFSDSFVKGVVPLQSHGVMLAVRGWTTERPAMIKLLLAAPLWSVFGL